MSPVRRAASSAMPLSPPAPAVTPASFDARHPTPQPRRTAKKTKRAVPKIGSDVHMMKVSTYERGRVSIVTTCGETGAPANEKPGSGLHTTIWPSFVTCPKCLAEPGITGVKIDPSKSYTTSCGPDCECRRLIPL